MTVSDRRDEDAEENLLRAVALQNATSILVAASVPKKSWFARRRPSS